MHDEAALTLEWRHATSERQNEISEELGRLRVLEDHNPAYRIARCGQQSVHGPHVVDYGPDEPRNCPGTGADNGLPQIQAHCAVCGQPSGDMQVCDPCTNREEARMKRADDI